MERIRQKMQLEGAHQELHALGVLPGVVSQDLGSTPYTISTHTKTANKFSVKAFVATKNQGNHDDLDITSSPRNLPAPSSRKYEKRKREATAETRRSKGGTRTPARPDLFSKEPERKNITRPSSATLFDRTTDFDMLPSNQLALETNGSSRKAPQRSPLEEVNSSNIKKSTSRRKLKAFPMEVPTSPPQAARRKPAPFPISSPTTKRKTQLGSSNSIQSQRQRGHGGNSPKAKRVLQRFPLDSPVTESFIKGPDISDDDDELTLKENDDQTILTFGAPRPFPMALSQIHLMPSKPKRTALDHSNDDKRQSKKLRSSPELESIEDLESLSLDADKNVDPSTICPYCDELWPSDPSPTLISLLERTKRKSYPDPRPGNASGLKAPLAVFVELCQRHRFEMTHLPLALERGWPTKLNFAGLPRRVEGYKKQLTRIVTKPDRSTFWRQVREDVKEIGRLKVVSVSGQYATFERTQPGYYGEQGSMIIHQSLYSLFPPDVIPVNLVDPLTPDQFLTWVLVPETAVLLIQEDMQLATKEEALRVLDESKKYGVAMFPEQAQEDDVAEVGEQLARERARARRKILEERGEADSDVKRQVELEAKEAKKAKSKAKANAKGKSRAVESSTDDTQEDEVEESSRKKWKAKAMVYTSKFGEPTPKARYKQRNLDGDDAAIKYTFDRDTPCSPKMQPMSTTDWRARHLPSTSHNTPPALGPLSQTSLHKSTARSSSLFSQGQSASEVYDLRSAPSFSDRGGADSDENLGAIREDDRPTTIPDASDSDVVVLVDRSPMSFKRKSRKAFQKKAISNASESEDPVIVISSLGSTKRKKGKRKNIVAQRDMDMDWLLDDPGIDR